LHDEGFYTSGILPALSEHPGSGGRVEAGRQFIRYVLPGGLAVLIAAIFEVLYGWAWETNLVQVINVAKENPLTTVGGAVILGFALYQLYYAFYRPIVRVRLPSLHRDRLIYPIKTSDVGGAVLKHLQGDEIAERAIVGGCKLEWGIGEWEWKPVIRSAQERIDYVDALSERNSAVRTLLNLTSDTGDTHIKESYTELADIYHALGACRAALGTMFSVALVVVAVEHNGQFGEHLARSILATAAALVLGGGAWYTIRVNRRDTLRTMTAQLGNDLRIWARRNQLLLTTLVGGGEPGAGK
jgi:hypothetical protein